MMLSLAIFALSSAVSTAILALPQHQWSTQFRDQAIYHMRSDRCDVIVSNRGQLLAVLADDEGVSNFAFNSLRSVLVIRLEHRRFLPTGELSLRWYSRLIWLSISPETIVPQSVLPLGSKILRDARLDVREILSVSDDGLSITAAFNGRGAGGGTNAVIRTINPFTQVFRDE